LLPELRTAHGLLGKLEHAASGTLEGCCLGVNSQTEGLELIFNTSTKVAEERAVHWARPWKQGHTILSEAQYDHWSGEGYHLGTNKEVFDAELYAIYRAVMRFGKRHEHDQEYTIFVDSQEAIKRGLTDHQGPGRRLRGLLSGGARASRIGATSCGCSGFPVAGNEVADRMAKAGAAGECHGDSESRRLLSRTSMAYLKRQATEAKSRDKLKKVLS